VSADLDALDLSEEIEAAWGIGPQVVVSVFDDDLGHDRTIRVTVTRGLPGGSYWSSYEEEIATRIDGQDRWLWVKVFLERARGESAVECLQSALDEVVSAMGGLPNTGAASP
jgi:hypothetical protein